VKALVICIGGIAATVVISIKNGSNRSSENNVRDLLRKMLSLCGLEVDVGGTGGLVEMSLRVIKVVEVIVGEETMVIAKVMGGVVVVVSLVSRWVSSGFRRLCAAARARTPVQCLARWGTTLKGFSEPMADITGNR
jgi:hypothetical protein